MLKGAPVPALIGYYFRDQKAKTKLNTCKTNTASFQNKIGTGVVLYELRLTTRERSFKRQLVV